MKNLKFSILLDDKYSSKLKSIATSSNQSFKQIARDIKKTGRLGHSLDTLNHKLDFLEKKRRLSVDTSEMKRLTKEIRQVNREVDLIERKSGMRAKKGGAGLMGKAGGMIASAGIAYGAVSLGTDIVQTSAKYEKFEAILKTSFGSSLKAKQSMADLQKFASGTPFQIDELTDSFIKLRSQGFTPTMSEMTKLGDIAASKGKSFEQLSEAMLDAQMGEFERLKEFGIKGSSKGKKYSFTFKNNTVEVEKNSDAVKDYILSLGKLGGVQGSMNAISKTTGGQLSNLADNWDQLKNIIGKTTSGPVKDAIGGISSLTGKIKEWFTVPLSQELREEKAGFNALVTSITGANVSTDERSQMLAQLQEQYPDFLGNLDAETASNEDLLKRLDAVNASYEKRIKLQSASEVTDFSKDLLQKAQNEKNRARQMLDLMQQAESGGESAKGALAKLKKEMTFTETAETLFSMGKSWDVLKAQYETQLTNSGKKVKQLEREVASASAYEKSTSIDNYISEKDKNITLKDKKLSKLYNKEEYLNLKSQLLEVKSILGAGTLKKSMRGVTIDYGQRANDIMAQIDAMFAGDEVKPRAFTKAQGIGKSRRFDSGVDTVAGDSRIAKNMTINIDQLMSGDIEIHSQTVKEGASEIKEHIVNALLSAVNDTNTM